MFANLAGYVWFCWEPSCCIYTLLYGVSRDKNAGEMAGNYGRELNEEKGFTS
jgi:hypothetical protein